MNPSAPSVSDSRALLEEARELAISLAESLAASSMPEQEKAAWAALLPEMRLDQLSRFAAALDVSVAQAAKAEVADVVRKMRTVLEKYAAQQSEADNEFMTGIAKMVEDLRKAERAAGE
jgi:hypothetical protein